MRASGTGIVTEERCMSFETSLPSGHLPARRRTWRESRAWALLLTLFFVVGGCGGGGSTTTTQQFFLQSIGPGGGTATGGPVTVTFPPGALPGNTSVAVLPELTPLPIQPPGNDPCTYVYAGPIHCVGPLSMQLAIPATLRVTYDEAQIPAGFTELDLVLLVSDPNANDTVMVPKIGPSVTQYTGSNYFEDTNYNPLGHVALGVRSCPVGGILVQNLVLPAVQAAAVNEGRIGLPELYIVDPAGATPPAFVETGGADFDAFLPSPSGDRLLLRIPNGQSEITELSTVPLPAGGIPSLVFTDDYAGGLFLQAYDPHFGWLAGSSSGEVFCTVYRDLQSNQVVAQGAEPNPTQIYELLRRDPVALPPPSAMRQRDADFYYPEDLRQSANGSHVMMRWGTSFQEGFATAAFIDGAVDVLSSPSGALQSEGSIPPNGFGGSSPRFMTGSTDLYVVDRFFGTVQAYAADGTPQGTLFDPAFKGEVLVDFALAPDDETFALVYDMPQFSEVVQQGLGTFSTVLAFGTLTEGIQETYWFYSQHAVEELVWHPQQTGVFLQLSEWGPGFYSLEDDDGTYIEETYLPIQSLSQLDVNRLDGRIAIVIRYFLDLVGPTGEALPQGLYVSPADASDFQLVPMEGITNPWNARWLQSWRQQPGMDGARVR
jgi:hypothetical protein